MVSWNYMSETLQDRFTDDEWREIEHRLDTTGESVVDAAGNLGIDVPDSPDDPLSNFQLPRYKGKSGPDIPPGTPSQEADSVEAILAEIAEITKENNPE